MQERLFFHKLKYLLNKQDIRMLFILLIMTIFLSLVETVGISAIMPFISTASNPELIYENRYYLIFYNFFNLKSSKEFVLYLGTILIIFYIFRGLYTIFYAYMLTKLSMGKYSDFANKLFENYINMPYIEFVKQNSSTMTRVIITEALQLSSMLRNILILFSEMLVTIILYGFLLFVNVKMTLVLTLLLSIKIFFLLKIISKKIKIEGDKRSIIQDKFYRIINETLRNFKIIKFISNQKKIMEKFVSISSRFTDIQIKNDTLQVIPKSTLEAVGLSILMGVVIYLVAFGDDISSIIPIISMYALALYRILPATTKILKSYNNIVFYYSSLNIVYNDMIFTYSKDQHNNKNISFRDKIYIDNISFSYERYETLINNLSLTIKKGEKVAFVGESGSGKSTFVDLVCGIYRPDSGKILIDGVELNNSNIVAWRGRIGYIPQDIYLFDGTIAENITFGREYDQGRLIEVLKQANIYEFIIQKDGFDTMVGDGGVQLSGGQKQRVGIARALYGDPEILVLDEATSALDEETERIIMDEIYKISEDKTLMIIAHRLSTIERCDVIIDISNKNNIVNI